MSSGSPVESVRRTLALLEELNRQRINSIQHLHEATALPKSTIVRLLETLRLLGYVANDPRQGGYQVTSGVRGLSLGFHGDPLVVLKAPGDMKAWEAHLADPIVTPQNTLDYYSAVEKAAGGSVADHFRLHHRGRLRPADRARKWVEDGVAPDSMLATKTDKDGNVLWTRPLCPFPQKTMYRGAGDTKNAANYRCETPPRSRTFNLWRFQA